MGLNENIKKYIDSKGITQKFLVDKTGITTVQMSMIINGKRKITGEELLKISKVLEVNPFIFLD